MSFNFCALSSEHELFLALVNFTPSTLIGVKLPQKKKNHATGCHDHKTSAKSWRDWSILGLYFWNIKWYYISQETKGGFGTKWGAAGGRLHVEEGRVRTPSCCQTWLLLPWCLWWCCSRRRRRRRWWRVALCTWCYLLKALLVPSMTVDTICGDLPPIWDILADLVPIAVPLAPLAVVLGCREAHLVLL